jgi:hypothetical protein
VFPFLPQSALSTLSRLGLPLYIGLIAMQNSFARRRAKERFGPNKIVRRDMLGAFLRHGMDPGEAERGGLLQLFITPYLHP